MGVRVFLSFLQLNSICFVQDQREYYIFHVRKIGSFNTIKNHNINHIFQVKIKQLSALFCINGLPVHLYLHPRVREMRTYPNSLYQSPYWYPFLKSLTTLNMLNISC